MWKRQWRNSKKTWLQWSNQIEYSMLNRWLSFLVNTVLINHIKDKSVHTSARVEAQVLQKVGIFLIVDSTTKA